VIPSLDYLTPLESNGIRVLLTEQEAALPKTWAREQFEAIIGLQYLYRGHSVVRDFVRTCFIDDLASQQVTDVADFKTLLQNLAQIDKQTPRYLTEREGGEDHNARFVSRVTLGRRVFHSAGGQRKKEAEADAAKKALTELVSDPRNRRKYERAVQLTIGAAKLSLRKYSLSRSRATECSTLASRIGLPSGDNSYLVDLALTHISWVRTHPEKRSYPRLAFIGSYLAEILVLEDCIRMFGWKMPGPGKEAYARKRRLVTSGVLPNVFDDLNLSSHTRTSGTPITNSIKCDVIQSLLGAAFIMAGVDATKLFWHKWIAPRITDSESVESNVDAVTTLQEIIQSISQQLPEYIISREPSSPGHQQRFRALCLVNGEEPGEGSGPSKKTAKQAAALKVLAKLQGQRDRIGGK
jgi:ribonuclease III